MSTSKVLKELNELKVEWKKQNLEFTPAQKDRYAELLNKRREIVSDYYNLLYLIQSLLIFYPHCWKLVKLLH